MILLEQLLRWVQIFIDADSTWLESLDGRQPLRSWVRYCALCVRTTQGIWTRSREVLSHRAYRRANRLSTGVHSPFSHTRSCWVFAWIQLLAHVTDRVIGWSSRCSPALRRTVLLGDSFHHRRELAHRTIAVRSEHLHHWIGGGIAADDYSNGDCPIDGDRIATVGTTIPRELTKRFPRQIHSSHVGVDDVLHSTHGGHHNCWNRPLPSDDYQNNPFRPVLVTNKSIY